MARALSLRLLLILTAGPLRSRRKHPIRGCCVGIYILRRGSKVGELPRNVDEHVTEEQPRIEVLELLFKWRHIPHTTYHIPHTTE